MPHNHIGFIPDRYGLKTISVRGMAPDFEPNPRQLAGTMAFAKDNDMAYIFDEPLANNRTVEVIAGENLAHIRLGMDSD